MTMPRPLCSRKRKYELSRYVSITAFVEQLGDTSILNRVLGGRIETRT